MTDDEASSRMKEIRTIVGFTAGELQALGDIAWEAECVSLARALDQETDRRFRSHFRLSASFLRGTEVTAGPAVPLCPSPDDPGTCR